MGTPDFAVPALKAIQSRWDLLCVFTQPDRPAGRGRDVIKSPVKLAARTGTEIFQPEKLNTPEVIEALKKMQPDFIVVAAYGQILKPAVLDVPRFGCVNIHASLLPRFRGASPIQSALIEGDSVTGISTMLMDPGLDTGPIFEQEEITIGPKESFASLHDRLSELGGKLIMSTLEGVNSGNLRPKNQSAIQKYGPATYVKKLTKDDQWLPLTEPASTLERRIRALNPWPGTSVRLLHGGMRLRILSAIADPVESIDPAVIANHCGRILLGTPSGALVLERMQWDNRNPMSSSDFVNGLAGMKLELPIKLELL